MAAKVEIFAHELKLDQDLRDYVTDKTERIDRYMDEVDEARVDLSFRRATRSAQDRYKAQITLRGKGFVLRAEEQTDQIQSAFDAVLDKIQRQMERYKGKHYRNRINAADLSEQELIEADAAEGDEPVLPIARTKKFMLYPMSPAEALEQMRLLGHEQFFVFYNMDAACVSVLYRRGDESFGQIDTELA
jgi:putative sigma-54 modulation protein